MNPEFALNLADVRLQQTWHLLTLSMKDHPDQEALAEVLKAICTSRAVIKNLHGDADSDHPQPALNAAPELPAA